MKTKIGKIEIISLTIADVAENLVRFKFGKVARTLFQLAHKEANLLEAEMGAPGKKLSYITKTREKFN